MNVPTLWRSISRTCYQALTKIPNQNCNVISPSRNMHYICSNKWFPIMPIVTPITAPMKTSELLKVTTPTITMTCGMKVRGKLKLRCKECYFVTRQERLYVMCKAKPRHKQMAMKKKPRNIWNLSHATQGKQREW